MKGTDFERTLTSWFNKMCENNICFFVKSPTPTIMKRKDDKFYLVYSTEKAICDYIGLFNKKFVLIEAKVINIKYWDKRRLKKHQNNQLVKINELEGISLIIFYIELEKKLLIMDIKTYNEKILNNEKKNINYDVLLQNGISFYFDYKEFSLFFRSRFLD